MLYPLQYLCVEKPMLLKILHIMQKNTYKQHVFIKVEETCEFEISVNHSKVLCVMVSYGNMLHGIIQQNTSINMLAIKTQFIPYNYVSLNKPWHIKHM